DGLSIEQTQISIDGRAYSNVDSPPTAEGDWDDGSHPWVTTSLADGSHTAQIRAQDSAGRWGYSSLRKVTVSNELDVRIIEPDSAALVTGVTRVLYTIDGAVGPGIIRVQKSVDSGTFADVTNAPTAAGDWDDGYDDWDTTTRPDGAHTVVIRVLRSNGAWSFSNERQVVADNTGPTLKSLRVDYAPDAEGDGSAARPGRTVEVSVLVRDRIAGVASGGVELDLRTLGLGTESMSRTSGADENGYEEYTLRLELPGSLAAKSYNIGASAEDRLGNRSDAEPGTIRVKSDDSDDNDDHHACAMTPLPHADAEFDRIVLILLGLALMIVVRRRS
ncbi:hypothetical protein KDL45_01965, partial [bacterium]|nr:hypothetical protein [bacterium]